MKGLGKLQEQRLISAVNFYKENIITISACAEKFSCDRHVLSRWLKKDGLNINPNGKQSLNSEIFSVINTEEKAYWLGFLYADGNVRENKISLELATKDKQHLIKFNQFMQKSKEIIISENRVRCLFMDKKVYQDLINLGVVPNKSLILNFPSYNQVPQHLIHHFIRGYTDGDGSIFIERKTKRIRFSVLGTKEFLQGIVNETKIPKRTFYKNNKNNDSNCWFFECSQSICLDLLEYLYKDCNIFLERKYEKYLEYCRLRGEIPKIITGQKR